MVAYTDYSGDPRVRREAEALAERGDSVDIITLDEPDKKKTEILNKVNVFRLRHKHYQGDNTFKYLVSYLVFFTKATCMLLLLYAKKHYRIIHIHSMPDFLVFVAFIPKLFGTKVILDMHDLMPELYISKFQIPEKHTLIRLITFIERLSIGFSHKTIAVHQPHLEILIKHGNPPSKFAVIMNVPDVKIFSKTEITHNSQKKKFVLIYHGTVAPRHGLETAIRSLPYLLKDIPNVELRIFGTGEDIDRLCDITKKLSLENYVYFNKKFIAQEAIVKEILDADIGVISIVNDEFTKYMLPTKLLEYIAMDIPVICTKTMTVQYYFDDSMVSFIEANDFKGLSEAVLKLYHNPEERNRLAVNAKSVYMKYRWEQHKLQLFSLVDNLVKK